MCFAPQRRALFRHLNCQKMPKAVRHSGASHILNWKCASRHNDVHFFDISTAKSCQKWSDTQVFYTFWIGNVLRATAACTFFDISTAKRCQKWSDTQVFCAFWNGNVLRATTACTFSTSKLPKVVRTWCFVDFDFEMCFATPACTFSTSQLPKMVRTWCALYILTWKCASRHNSVHFPTFELPKVARHWGALQILNWKCASRHNDVHFFYISTAKSGPHLVCYAGSAPAALASLLFDPPEPQIIGKTMRNTVFRDFPTFSRICIFFLLTLCSSNFSLLSASSLLCFSSVHIVGSLTSKLPSINMGGFLLLLLLLLLLSWCFTVSHVVLWPTILASHQVGMSANIVLVEFW